MRTHWQVDVSWPEGHGSMCTCKATLPEAIAAGYEHATYYAIQCGYSPRVTLEERCEACGGEGLVYSAANGRVAKASRCKACKGHQGPLQTIGPVALIVHENAADNLREHGWVKGEGLPSNLVDAQ